MQALKKKKRDTHQSKQIETKAAGAITTIKVSAKEEKEKEKKKKKDNHEESQRRVEQFFFFVSPKRTGRRRTHKS